MPQLGMLIVVLVLAGGVQALVIATDWFGSLAVPLDLGRTWHGHRLLGDNKTVRGALVMVVATTGFAAVLFPRFPPFSPPPPGGWAVLGALMGTAYILAELPNSFVKRRLGIEPGSEVQGTGRLLQYLIDQGDSVLGVVVLLAVVTDLAPAELAVLTVVGIAVHTAVDLALHALGIKQAPRSERHGAPRA